MKRTLADYALELSSKASKGWKAKIRIAGDYRGMASLTMSEYFPPDTHPHYSKEDAEFIAASRVLLPELARRLQRACEALRDYSHLISGVTIHPFEMRSLADELEKPLEEK